VKRSLPKVTLFIVPCPWAGTGSASPSAAKSASTMRPDVSTFPAATAAGGSALTSEPSGALTETGANAPPDEGKSGAVRQRTTK
jgi:hypothetical protein